MNDTPLLGILCIASFVTVALFPLVWMILDIISMSLEDK